MFLSLCWSLIRQVNLTQWLFVGALAIITGLSLQVAVERNAREKAEASERIAQISALNTAALHDSTRKYSSDTIRALQQNLLVYQRLIIQEKQKQNLLDQQLGQLTLANYNLRLKIDTLSELLTGVVRNDNDSLKATFNINKSPYRVKADVALPLVSQSEAGQGRMLLDIVQDPLTLQVNVGCLKEQRNGVRPAQLNVVAPKYVNVFLDSLTQSPEVCSPTPMPKPQTTLHKIWSQSKKAAIVVGAFLLGRGSN